MDTGDAIILELFPRALRRFRKLAMPHKAHLAKQDVCDTPDFSMHIDIPKECDWERLCTSLIVLAQLKWNGRTMLWHLPVGWRERLEKSLYTTFHAVVDSRRALFMEYEGNSFTPQLNDAKPVLRFSGPTLRETVNAGNVLQILDVSQFARFVSTPGSADARWISQLAENRTKLSALKNQRSGGRAFVIGNGPSLARTDLRSLEGELTLGSNGLFLLEQMYHFRPTVYVVEDRLFAEDRVADINAYDGTLKLFPWDQRERLQGHAYLPLVREYNPYPQFSTDISAAVYTGWTVTYVLLQLALFIGATQVILVGVDGTYPNVIDQPDKGIVVSEAADNNHFTTDYFGPGKRFHKPQPERVRIAYEYAKECFRLAGGEVLNATSGGTLDVFSRVNLHDVLN